MRQLLPALVLAAAVVACGDDGPCTLYGPNEDGPPLDSIVTDVAEEWTVVDDGDELRGRREGRHVVRIVREGRDARFPDHCDIVWEGQWDLVARLAQGNETARETVRTLHGPSPEPPPWDELDPRVRAITDAPEAVRDELVSVNLEVQGTHGVACSFVPDVGWNDCAGLPNDDGIPVWFAPGEPLEVWLILDESGSWSAPRRLVATSTRRRTPMVERSG